MTTLYLKNMVCHRCILVVQQVLSDLGLNPVQVILGEATVAQEISPEQRNTLAERLQGLGFALIDDKKSQTIEKIKTLIVDLVHQRNATLRTNLSDYLTQHLAQEYYYLSALFSEVEGTTIERYFIAQKIERVKELLVYGELSLSEIAHLLNYSSVAHLSSQFKKITGLTPSHFKQIKEYKRTELDKI